MDEILARIWENLGGRIGGPLTFRLLLQPTVAAIVAIRAGLRDARTGRPAYLWAVFSDPAHLGDLLRDGWKDIAKVFVAAFAIDAVYQWLVLRWFYPGEALIVSVLLACVPYVLVRGPVARLARARRRPVGESR